MAEQEDSGAALAVEAVRLFAAVQDWARRTLPGPVDGHDGPECQWCPLCKLAAVLRGDRPEVTERVIEAGAAMASVVRALLDQASTGVGSAGGEPPPRSPRVQHIDLGKSDE